MASIKLYQFEDCSFCANVRSVLDEKGITYQKINVPVDQDAPIRMELLDETEVHTVPVIEIDGEYIADSTDIIAHILDNF